LTPMPTATLTPMPTATLTPMPTATLTPMPTATPISAETLITNYISEQSGGFSPQWVVYVFYPTSDFPEQQYEVEINGTRMGPYTNLSTRVEVSPNGEHVAFTVERDGKWVIFVDGEEQWEYDGLAWPWWSWGPDLEGRAYVPQTQAAVMEFSNTGNTLAYIVNTGDGKWAMCQNGRQGEMYESIYLDFVFIDETLIYHAITEQGEVVVYGNEVLGPFTSVYRIKQSPNEEHVVFYAIGMDGTQSLYLDGKAIQLSEEIIAYEVSDSGDIAVVKQVEGKYEVYINDQLIAGMLDEVKFLTPSPDGKHVAFWARKNAQWFVFKDQQEYAIGEHRYYYYESGGLTYTIMWDPTFAHVAYFVNTGEEIIQYVDEEPFSIKWEGLGVTNYVDDQGQTVGERLLNGPMPDKQGYVACLLTQEQTNCDPFSSIMIGDQSAYREQNEEGSSMIIGTQKVGPFEAITNIVTDAPSNHYAFTAITDQGYQVVLDGLLSDKVYDSIYKLRPVSEIGVLFLGIRDGQIYRVFLAWP